MAFRSLPVAPIHLLLLLGIPVVGLSQETAGIKKTNLETPNVPLVADLVHTPEPELVLTDVRGRIRMYNAITLEELAAATIGTGDTAITAPVYGDFNGDDLPEIAVGTLDGRIVLVSGTSLRTITEIKPPQGKSISITPTIIPRMVGDVRRDMIAHIDQAGVIYVHEMDDKGKLVQVTSHSAGTTTKSPLTFGHIRSADTIDLVCTTGDSKLIFVNIDGKFPSIPFYVPASGPISFSALTVDLDSDGIDEVVITHDRAEIRAYRFDPIEKKIVAYWANPARITSGAVGPPTLLQRQADGVGSVAILQATASALHVVNGDGKVVTEDLTSRSGINTEVALIPQAGKWPEIAYGRGVTIEVTRNMDSWIQNSAKGEKLASEISDVKHRLQGGLVTAVATDGDAVYVLGTSIDKESVLFSTKTPFYVPTSLWQTRSPWATAGGSPLHNPRLDRSFAALEKARLERLAKRVAGWQGELDAASKEGEWAKASTIAAALVEYDPHDNALVSQQRTITFRRFLLPIVGSVVAALLLIGYSTFKTTQFLTRRHLRRRAEFASNRGDYEEAKRFYLRLYAKVPRNAKVAFALARVYMALRDYSSEALAVYERAWHSHGNDQDLLHAYARALLVEPATSAHARAVYEKGLATFPEPHWLEYGIGRCDMAAGNFEEAGRRLRSALRGGVTSEALYRSLCDVYLKTRSFTAKSLPVFEQQFPHRREDKEFLEGYLMACIDGKQTDQKVESLAQSVLEVSPGFVPAYLLLAQVLLQKNQVGQAIEEIRQAIQMDPDNAHALTLLAHSFLIQNRRDEEALQAYRRSLAVSPNDKDITRTMAQIYFDRGQYDQEAVATYHRSLELNPADTTTLKALAQTAQLAGNGELAVRTIESLANMGQINQKLVLQLAQAYVKLGVNDPKAERIFKEALRIEPNNLEYTSALALVLCGQDRTEVECIAFYENHLQNLRNDVTVGRQLAKAYIKANRYEKALATTKRFLQIAPDDEELQRLNALASLYDNKIDEAVSEYQRLLERNPDDKEALVNLALAYGQKLRTDQEAINLFQKALAIQPMNDLLYIAMARVCAERNDPAKAVENYKEALRVRENNEQNVIAQIGGVLTEHPEMLRIRWFLVELLVSCGYFREALEQIDYISINHPGQGNNTLRAIETILSKDQNNVTALVQQGMMLLAAGKHAESVKALEKAYTLRPTEADIQEKLILALKAVLEKKEDPDQRFRLGRVYYTRQEFDLAIGCFQKTAQDYRWEADSTKMLGKCFTGKGMLDLALQEFRKVVVDDETKELLYDLAQRYETKKDLVGAKTVYRQLFAADIGYKDVKKRFEMLSGSTSDPMAFEKTSIVQQMSEEAARRYELLDELGRGAMGIVYRARDKELEEVVALKILPDNMSNNPEAVRRFKIEARNARKLSHPNIVRIHDIGEEMGRKYISMEYVDGSDLKKKVKSAPDFRIPTRDAIKYSMAIADALGYAHRLGIVHRDIKPANIMLTSHDEVKVTDFGIAKMMDGSGEGTMIGAVIGTPLYMSPEQVQGIPVDNRADIYAFGIMFYELLSGRPPFTEGDLAYQHLHREPNPIDDIPPEIWRIVKKCLEKKKEDRWEKAELIYDALREFQKQKAEN